MEHSCSGNCAGCNGCAKELSLSQPEIDLLLALAQVAFLPVARKADDMTPICLEPLPWDGQTLSLALQCLEKKGLIDIDYRQPLAGCDYSAYQAWPCHGSVGLTARGQGVLELMECMGITEEN